MSRKNQELFTAEELKQIGAGIALFVGTLSLAALLKPLTPWARRNAQPQPSPSTDPTESSKPKNENEDQPYES